MKHNSINNDKKQKREGRFGQIGMLTCLSWTRFVQKYKRKDNNEPELGIGKPRIVCWKHRKICFRRPWTERDSESLYSVIGIRFLQMDRRRRRRNARWTWKRRGWNNRRTRVRCGWKRRKDRAGMAANRGRKGRKTQGVFNLGQKIRQLEKDEKNIKLEIEGTKMTQSHSQPIYVRTR